MKRRYISLFSVLLLSLLPVVSVANNHAGEKADEVVANDTINDAAIILKIKDKMKAEPLLKNTNIEIASNYGEVMLSGLVDTKLQAEKIITFAQSIEWVKGGGCAKFKSKK